MAKHTLLLNLLITALAPMVWGSTYIVTTELLPPDMPLLASTLRALPAGLILLALCRTAPRRGWWVRVAILGILNIGAFFYFLFVAAYYLPGGIAALVMSCQPLIVMFFSVMLLKTRLSFHHALAAVFGITGVAMLVLNASAGISWQGILAGVAGSICMAGGIVLTKYWGRPDGLSLLSFTGWQLTFGGLFLLPLTLLLEGLPSSLSVNNVLGYSYLALIGAVFSYMIWFRGIEKLPTVTTSFIGFLSPVSACLLGFFILGETLSQYQLLGAFSIVIALYFSLPRPQAATTTTLTTQLSK
ncbi:EamA family transporter [Photobacterium ganghwense]|uniref:EamA family transporter n=1 Tax=Photobacterium ganghwense TaxID=320778 RepID=UPI0040563E34